MALGQRLQARRERLALTQETVAQALGVPRELISLWESGNRNPSQKKLNQLAFLYGVSSDYLLGKEELGHGHEWQKVYGELPENTQVQREVRHWARFLDAWATFLEEDLGEKLPGPSKPPRKLDQGQILTDARRASALAEQVREFYHLGRDAIPDLYAFLDEAGVLVYRAPLGSIKTGQGGVSGAFFNHPKLGYSVLVNTNTSPGRQAFTLAHEFAHALYHHSRSGIISRKGERDPFESFANAFAAKFLVSGRELRDRGREGIGPYEALKLASYFGVSYATILIRLREEKLISLEQFEEFSRYSPRRLAQRIGLNPAEFSLPEPDHTPLNLGRYPVSVLEKTQRAIRDDVISPPQAAKLLDVDVKIIEEQLLEVFPEASEEELWEFEELPF